MLKYLYCKEVFSEVPDEISLALSISNCNIRCDGCNQKELWDDIGKPLSWDSLSSLLSSHRGITCVCFMGSGGGEYKSLNKLATHLKREGYKVAIYLGEDSIPSELNIQVFDYIKIGHWDPTKGGLDSPTTNQKMYFIEHQGDGSYYEHLITYKFRKTNEN